MMRTRLTFFLLGLAAAATLTQPTVAFAQQVTEPALILATRQQSREQVESLIAGKRNLNELGFYGQTALHEAAGKCNPELARLLVDAGANRNLVDHSGRTPAMVAMHCNDGKALHQLLGALYVLPANLKNYQGSAEDRRRWTLHGAASRGDINTVNLMLQLGHNVNGLDEQGDRALEIACRRGDPRIVGILLNRGADVQAATSAGTTVLHEAALGGSPEVVTLVLAKGAAVNATDKDSAATPLHYASSFGRIEVVRVLLNHGADTTLKDGEGRNAQQAAMASGQEAVAALLREAQAK